MKFSRMLLISRPIFWLATGGMYLVGMGSMRNFTPLAVLEGIFFLFPLNFFLYGLNDVYDGRSDHLNPRKGGMHGALLDGAEVKRLKKYVLIPAIAFLLLAALSLNLEHFLLSLLFVALGFAYSHPITRFKEVPLLDALVSTVGYFCPLLIAFSIHSSILEIPGKYFLLGLPLVGVHAITTLADAKWDAKGGMKSTGIFLGKNKTLALIGGTMFVPLFFFWADLFLVSELIFCMFCCVLLFFLRGKEYERALQNVAGSFVALFTVSLLYFVLSANL